MSESNNVRKTIANPEIHKGWEKNYRTTENERFFELAFDYIVNRINADKGSSILDAGCGSCRHSLRLAKYGFDVTAVDFSDYIIEKAKQSINESEFNGQIQIQQEDLLNFSFTDESFDYVLCWGVLMHIPNIEKAISEVARVLKPGGTLVLSEVNMSSMEVKATEILRPLLGKGHIRSEKKDAGIETWAETDYGRLLSRRVNVPWLVTEFEKYDVHLAERKSGQFTEMYTRFSNRLLHRSIHNFNNFWFKHINLPSLACGNIIILKKNVTT